MVFGQGDYEVRFDWGPVGASAIAPGAALVAVVDVLSFTTALTVAVEQGAAVLPYPWRDDSAAEAAARHQAVLAVGRSAAGPGQVSLSPATIVEAASRRRIDRLVLPSPNGSAISAGLAATGATVVGVSLRNAGAAAAWVREQAAGQPVAVVAAGERWPDGSLRPAVEDLWGAGAFLHFLSGSGEPAAGFSPEAGAAVAAYRAVAGDLPGAVAETASGRELIAGGFRADVEVAAAAGVSTAVPVLREGWFRAPHRSAAS
ncbi:2-phosphosulfolactate phosphatase [Actinoplanes lutulentus]|uniref:Probable 2-phosphosulfolactate phosphatase n=1 Tax=Actinoplanes lutulentus TaxID=1287878 RepID=A0A327YYJ2_9ACTN|nr:2-phosphosulfolactate phosphatase [Actinoplanes lutulentus]MBB2942962.1 2-phosphosulfolactate phosphatase [Actinoplanes lutulentus]RAK26772.1 2-phosphosulfolactate phosphatase [Actinoplanes lutulentus]